MVPICTEMMTDADKHTPEYTRTQPQPGSEVDNEKDTMITNPVELLTIETQTVRAKLNGPVHQVCPIIVRLVFSCW